MNTNDPDERAADPGRETPRTIMVELPGTPPEGKQWVAAFRQPLPMEGMSLLCKAFAKAYGEGARIHPCGDWVAVSGDLAHDKPEPAAPKAWRVCEMMPMDGTDGGRMEAETPEAAAAMAAKRHPGLMEYESLYVWPDGEEPTPENLRGVPTKALRFADEVTNPQQPTA